MLRTVSFSLRHFKVSSINFWFSSAWSCVVMVRVLDLQLKGCRFDPWPFCFQVTTLGKLFTHVPLSPSSKFGGGEPCGWESKHASQTSVVYPPPGSRLKQGR